MSSDGIVGLMIRGIQGLVVFYALLKVVEILFNVPIPFI